MATASGFDPKLASRLASKKAAVRESAEQELTGMGPDAVEGLLALLESEARKRRRRKIAGVAAIIVYIAVVAVMALTRNGESIASFTSIIGSLGAMFAASQLQKDTAKALLRFDDVRTVGGLAEALEFDDKGVARGAEDALTKLLPRLRASDHMLLTPDQRRCLDRALAKKPKVSFSLAVLDAYEQVGDETSVVLVEKVASGGVRTVRDQRVIARAAEVLPAMRERARIVKAAQTLLRPADAVGDDMLLRPASGPPSGEVETLLRPVEDSGYAEHTCTTTEADEALTIRKTAG